MAHFANGSSKTAHTSSRSHLADFLFLCDAALSLDYKLTKLLESYIDSERTYEFTILEVFQ